MPWHESIIEAELAKTKMLVNATSIGLDGRRVAGARPRSSHPELLVLDLIYAKTRLLRDAAAAGCVDVGRRVDAAPPGRGGVHAVDRASPRRSRSWARRSGRRPGEGPSLGRGRAGGDASGADRRPSPRRADRHRGDMDRFRFITSGESHGPMLGAVVEGVPAGLALTEDDLAVDLARRQRGYGRGARQAIEHDRARILSGVRHGRTLGSPILLEVDEPRLGELDPRDAGRAAERRGGRRARRARRRRQQARPADHPRPARARGPRRRAEVRLQRRAQRARALVARARRRRGSRRAASRGRSCASSGSRSGRSPPRWAASPSTRRARRGPATRPTTLPSAARTRTPRRR